MSEPADVRRTLRHALRTQRAELDDDDQAAASMAVMARIARLPVLRSAGTIAGYRAVRGELDIDAALILLAERGATITVPRVTGEHLDFVRWHEDDDQAPGPFGIPEPTTGERIPLERHDAVLVPLVAFDPTGTRLGQGGGFYDRMLGAMVTGRPTVIGIAHGFQQVERVPREPWDVPLDAVVTEDEVIEFRPGAIDPAISPEGPSRE